MDSGELVLAGWDFESLEAEIFAGFVDSRQTV
jgi:hypothetical protein